MNYLYYANPAENSTGESPGHSVGGDVSISVQTMVKVPTENYDDVMREIKSTVSIHVEDLPEREQNILKELQCWEDALNSALSYRHHPGECTL